MSSLVEAIAARTWAVIEPGDPWGSAHNVFLKRRHLILVRAVIDAIGEPTDAMVEAGMAAYWKARQDGFDSAHPRSTWHAMIDAALREPEER
jgi:hypothetical protein